jgi:hypothetical protein
MKLFPSLALAALGACAASYALAGEIVTFDVSKDATFANARAMLTDYASMHSKARRNNFCILGVEDDGVRVAWIVWKQANRIILWEGQDLRAINSRRDLDLQKDVVASESQLHGSTYRVTRDWVREIETDCRNRGLQIVAPRPTH